MRISGNAIAKASARKRGTRSHLRILSLLLAALVSLFIPAPASAQPLPPAHAQLPSAVTASPGAGYSSPNGILFIGTSSLKPSYVRAERSGLKDSLAGFTFAALTARTFSPNTCFSEGWLHLRTSGDVQDPAERIHLSGYASCAGFKLRDEQGYALAPTSPILAASTPTATTPTPKEIDIENYAQRTEEMDLLSQRLFSDQAWALGEGAAAAVADTSGHVQHWLPMPTLLHGNTTSERLYREEVTAVFDAAPDDVVMDLSVPATGSTLLLEKNVREQQVTEALRLVLEANAASASPRPVIIASLSNLPATRSIQFFATNLPGLSASEAAAAATPAPGLLRSSTTKTEGLITIADIRYILSQTQGNTATTSNIGAAAFSVAAQPDIDSALKKVAEIEVHSAVALRANSSWYSLFTTLGLIGIASFLILLFISPWLKTRAIPFVKNPYQFWHLIELWAHATYAFVPAAFILNFIPWWQLPWLSRTSLTAVTALTLTALIALIVTILTRLTRHPIATTSLIAVALLAADILAGSAHQQNGFMGSLILSSRRYYGISNRTYVILIIAGLLALIPVIVRYYSSRKAGIIVGVTGLAILAVDAVPSWGADFGGPPGIIAAFGTAAVLAAGIKFRWWFVMVWLGLSGAAMGLIGLASARSSSTSHIGNFWQSLGSPESFALIAGKIRDVRRSFTAYPRTLIMVVLIVLVVAVSLVVLAKLAQRYPIYSELWAAASSKKYLRITAIGIALGIFIAVPINDSGMLMIKESIYIAAPALMALAAAEILGRNIEDVQAPSSASKTSAVPS